MERWGVGQVPFSELSTHSSHAPAPLCCVALLVKYLICDSYLASIAMDGCVGCLKIHWQGGHASAQARHREPELPRGRARRERERRRVRESAGKEKSGWKGDGGRSC